MMNKILSPKPFDEILNDLKTMDLFQLEQLCEYYMHQIVDFRELQDDLKSKFNDIPCYIETSSKIYHILIPSFSHYTEVSVYLENIIEEFTLKQRIINNCLVDLRTEISSKMFKEIESIFSGKHYL